MDHEIVYSLANTVGAETVLNHVWNVTDEAQVQLGEDIDESIMLESDPICSTAGCTQYNHPNKSESALIPRDYFVPNFGKDSDMSGTMSSLSIAEEQRKHKLIMGTPESRAKYANKAKDTKYNYYPKLDADVKVSQKNLADTEALLGHNLNVQIDSSSDPICSSGGCTQYNHPNKSDSALIKRDYFVPNFGKDTDMSGTMNSLSIAEAQ